MYVLWRVETFLNRRDIYQLTQKEESISTHPSFIPGGCCVTKEVACILELYPTHMTTFGQH